jgi:hypothetical protein
MPLAFRNGRDADPNVIGRSLAEIAAAHDGQLRPRDIVEQARAPRHPLHQYFEWNVEAAAQAHWLNTARALTRSVMIIDGKHPGEPPKRAWLSVDDADGVSYHSIDTVLKSADLKLAVMRRAERNLRAWEQRYQEIKDVLEVVTTARRKSARGVQRISRTRLCA